MENAIQSLFNYLRDILYDPDNASLDIDDLPDELKELAGGIVFFSSFVLETKKIALSLSRGDLEVTPVSKGNEIAAPLKSLHASLRHLTWQAQRIAQGDYNQRVAFMGDFSKAFNSMVEQLAEREQRLEEKVIQIEEKSAALEQGNQFFSALIHYVPNEMFVVNSTSGEILMCNESASEKIKHYESYLKDVIALTRENGNDVEISYNSYDNTLYLQVNKFSLDWYNEKAEIYIIDDVTETRNELADLEAHAFTDTMTNLSNRAYGMAALNIWIKEKKKFALIFVDLDSLKYLNDSFGHAEGDLFITRTAYELAKFSHDTITCRIGGDEFMLLAPDVGFDAANKKMIEISKILKTYRHDCDKDFRYSISYGIAVVDENSKLGASDILHVADLRMYDHKQYNKRKNQMSARSKK